MRAAAGWASMFGLISVAAVGGLALRASSSHYMIVWLLFLGLIWIVLPLWLIQLVWCLIRARKARDDSSVRMLPGPLTVGWLASAAALSLALGTAVATSDLERARSSAERALPIVENRLRDGGTGRSITACGRAHGRRLPRGDRGGIALPAFRCGRGRRMSRRRARVDSLVLRS